MLSALSKEKVRPLIELNDRINSLTQAKEKAGGCHLSENYMSIAELEKSLGATPSEVDAKVHQGKEFTRKTMGSSQWGGWSAVLFADPEVLCHDAEDCTIWPSSFWSFASRSASATRRSTIWSE